MVVVIHVPGILRVVIQEAVATMMILILLLELYAVHAAEELLRMLMSMMQVFSLHIKAAHRHML